MSASTYMSRFHCEKTNQKRKKSILKTLVDSRRTRSSRAVEANSQNVLLFVPKLQWDYFRFTSSFFDTLDLIKKRKYQNHIYRHTHTHIYTHKKTIPVIIE